MVGVSNNITPLPFDEKTAALHVAKATEYASEGSPLQAITESVQFMLPSHTYNPGTTLVAIWNATIIHNERVHDLRSLPQEERLAAIEKQAQSAVTAVDSIQSLIAIAFMAFIVFLVLAIMIRRVIRSRRKDAEEYDAYTSWKRSFNRNT
jgi:hypothetical protein